MNQIVPCWIYRSSRKDEMFLYLTGEEAFDDVPKLLMEQFGSPELVMQLDLHPERRLAREEVSKVIDNLQQRGFHLQMPPVLKPDLYEGG
ncbi:MAG: YcgL domain-containing protein [Gammaproteobacteria bacterium]|nr:YcgL domain-containing protein [Gammaproteobacteria bacterium]